MSSCEKDDSISEEITQEEMDSTDQSGNDDNSDESECKLLSAPKTYNKNLLPAPNPDSPIQLSLIMSFMRLMSIDTAEMRFTCQFVLHRQWADYRLTYNHLNPIETKNSLSQGNDQKDFQMAFEGSGLSPAQIEEIRDC